MQSRKYSVAEGNYTPDYMPRKYTLSRKCYKKHFLKSSTISTETPTCSSNQILLSIGAD